MVIQEDWIQAVVTGGVSPIIVIGHSLKWLVTDLGVI